VTGQYCYLVGTARNCYQAPNLKKNRRLSFHIDLHKYINPDRNVSYRNLFTFSNNQVASITIIGEREREKKINNNNK
jgi:hypothetical protein